jgi:hypothetical protein
MKTKSNLRQRLAAAFLTTSLACGSALAVVGVMDAYQNGYYWVGEACDGDPRQNCIEIKCDALYGHGSEASRLCQTGAVAADVFHTVHGTWPKKTTPPGTPV